MAQPLETQVLEASIDRYFTIATSEHTWARATRREHEKALARLLEVTRSTPSGRVDRDAIEAWFIAQQAQSYDQKRHWFHAIRSFCRWATTEGLLPTDPTGHFHLAATGQWTYEPPTPLSVLLDRFLEHDIATRRLSPTTIPEYERPLRQFARLYGDRDPAAITTGDIEVWLAQLSAANPALRLRGLRRLSHYCQWALDQGLLASDPTVPIRRTGGRWRTDARGETLWPHVLDYLEHGTPVTWATGNLVERYRHLKKLSAFLGPRPLTDIDLDLVCDWLATLEHLSNRSRQHHLRSVAYWCDWAHHKGLIGSNPTLYVRVSKGPGRPPWDEILRDSPLWPSMQTFVCESQTCGYYTSATAAGANGDLRRFAVWFGNRPLHELDRAAVLDWLDSLAHLAQASRYGRHATLRTYARWAVARGHLAQDPTATIRLATPRARAPRALTRQAVIAALRACDNDQERAIVWLMAGLGLRAIEIARADWADYDQTRQQLIVHGKGGYERIVPVTGPVAAALTAIDPAASGLMFGDGHLDEYTRSYRIRSRISKVIQRAGIKAAPGDGVAPHALRHTAADVLYTLTHDLPAVQRLLGHADITTTVNYVNDIDVDALRSAMACIDYQEGPPSPTAGPVPRAKISMSQRHPRPPHYRNPTQRSSGPRVRTRRQFP